MATLNYDYIKLWLHYIMATLNYGHIKYGHIKLWLH